MDSYTEMKCAEPPSSETVQMSGKRVLHFSDGTLDLDELDTPQVVEQPAPVDPQTLTWGPWMWYYTVFAGSKALEACDYMGEFLAEFFGITTPKYQYEIDEYHRMKREVSSIIYPKEIKS
ncbi:UNVERIFIED_CONTAM: hypothetical protein PYX00_000972 [Menopon gallinae]|uniref:Uncharacterized protein n=1 Tax=Menopon gallinae TaxID=328185 RepID=A0AAW2IAJ9_9NEOP